MENLNNSSRGDDGNGNSSGNSRNNKISLTRREKLDVVCLVLSFSCVVASLTLVVGTGAVVIGSIRGSTTIAPFALACFFLGMATVSLIFTHWFFEKHGRKKGFWIGCFMTIVGSGIAIGGLFLSSPPIVLVANAVLGMGIGVAMYLRFAAVEVVPSQFAPKAVTWTLCGGCIAAFAGPEIAASTKGAFGNDNLTYLGVFIITAAFSVCEAILVGFIRFEKQSSVTESSTLAADVPSTNVSSKEIASDHPRFFEVCQSDLAHPQTVKDDSGDVEMQDSTKELDHDQKKLGQNEASSTHESMKNPVVTTPATVTDLPETSPQLGVLLRQSSFILPVLISILSWSIMAMPMSIFRVTMREIGFTDRQSLTVIELHFLSMYLPGFWSGGIISRFGTIKASYVAISCFLIAIAVNLSAPGSTVTSATWFLGLIFLGIGWNFGFSAATVWVQRVYATPDHRHLKSKIQAANEFITFLCAGGLVFSTGYINQAGGGGLDGWRLLNIVIAAFTLVLIVVVCVAVRIDKREKISLARKDLGQTARLEVDEK